jgi:hypothetical protein
MAILHFTTQIKAPKQRVWEIMLSDKTYREWTAAFHEGSYFAGSWDEGSPIRFLAMDDGSLGGMFSKIVKNIPYEYISIEHLGEVIDGKEDTTSESAKQWAGSHENYTFTELDGVTTLTVELDGEGVSEEMTGMFEEMWPPALSKLKEIAEK